MRLVEGRKLWESGGIGVGYLCAEVFGEEVLGLRGWKLFDLNIFRKA